MIMDFEVTGTKVLLFTLAILVLTIALVFIIRYVFFRRSEKNMAQGPQHRHFSSPLEGRNKYPDLDTFSLRGTLLNYGLLASLVLMILAFSWTQYEKTIDLSSFLDTLEEEIEVETPRTAEPPPPPPPPPPPVIQEVPNDVSIEETIVFEDQSIKEETPVVAPPVVEKAPPPPPPPPAPKEDEIFKVVEDQPAFPGCESVTNKDEKKKCSDEKMLQFIYSNIKYPAIARENGVEGTAVIRFVVEKDGSITAPEIVRDIGAGCGEEAMRVVKMMPHWNPGKQRGRPVRVQFNLPIRFKLE